MLLSHRTFRFPRFDTLQLFIVLAIVAVLAFAFTPKAEAQTPPTCSQRLDGPYTDVRVTWAAPTQYVSNAAIPANAAFTFTVFRANGASGGEFTAQCQTTAFAATVYHGNAGTFRYYVTATLAGETSAPSATGSKTIVEPTPVPKPPTLTGVN